MKAAQQMLLERGIIKSLEDIHGPVGVESLFLAIEQEDIEVVQALCAAGTHVNACDRFQSTPLMRAAAKGSTTCVQFLLEVGANVNASDFVGWSPLRYAVKYVQTECVNLLLEAGAHVDERDSQGITPLQAALQDNLSAYEAKIECVRLLIEHGAEYYPILINAPKECVETLLKAGADINIKDDKGKTPLMHAALNGQAERIQLLLELGAETELKENNGLTALSQSFLLGHEACVKVLISAGADANAKDKCGLTPLIRAARDGKTEYTRLFVSSGSSPDVPSDNGNTPLMFAARNGHADCVELLLSAHANVNIHNKKGGTALMRAAYNGRARCVKLLIAAGADVNARDVKENTALILAANKGHYDCLKMIMDARADIDACNTKGRTALMQAVTNEHIECVDILLSANADINIVDNDEKTVFEHVENNMNMEIVDLLMNANARRGQRGREARMDETQQATFDKIKSNPQQNFFIQGQAGTGKSFLIKHIREKLGRQVAVVAPTGIAAQLIDGVTINSLFCLGALPYFRLDVVKQYRFYNEIVKQIETLIIDEVSMLRADVLDAINILCQKAKNNNKIFGGIQIVLVGDLYQLPPVYDSEDVDVQRYMEATYHAPTPFFFDATCYKDANFNKIELKKVYRQTNDLQFLKDLQTISIKNAPNNQQAVQEALASLNMHVEPDAVSKDFSVVTSTREAAKNINEEKLAKLPTPEKSYIGSIDNPQYQNADWIAPFELRLKIGAKVMFCRNEKNVYMNGTMGVVTSLSDNCIQVRTEKGVDVDVYRYKWEKKKYIESKEGESPLELVTVATYEQFPLKLAYAITIHKSQGQTWEHVCIDLGNGAFATGQTYVALSRVKTASGVHLVQKISPDDIKPNERIQEFLKTGIVPLSMPTSTNWDRADGNSVIDFWSTRFPCISDSQNVCHFANQKTVRKINKTRKFPTACFWFTLSKGLLRHKNNIFLIFINSNSRTSAIFKIPSEDIMRKDFKLDRDVYTTNPDRYSLDDNGERYRNDKFDIFVETGTPYEEIMSGFEFGKYLLATEVDWQIQ